MKLRLAFHSLVKENKGEKSVKKKILYYSFAPPAAQGGPIWKCAARVGDSIYITLRRRRFPTKCSRRANRTRPSPRNAPAPDFPNTRTGRAVMRIICEGGVHRELEGGGCEERGEEGEGKTRRESVSQVSLGEGYAPFSLDQHPSTNHDSHSSPLSQALLVDFRRRNASWERGEST